MTDGPCLKPDCKCCLWFMDTIRKMIVISGGTISMLEQAIKGRMTDQKTIQKLESRREALAQDNDRYKTANKELNAKVNKIKIVSANTRTISGRRVGRPKGTKPTINKKPEKVDREETIDCKKCPKCGGGRLSARVCDRFDLYVECMQIQWETGFPVQGRVVALNNIDSSRNLATVRPKHAMRGPLACVLGLFFTKSYQNEVGTGAKIHDGA